MFEMKPDFDDVLERYEAWWECAIVDRPLVSIAYAKPESQHRALPPSSHATLRERWLDTGYVVERADAALSNTAHVADSLPIAWPNLGPDVFASFYGCDQTFGETTVWSHPILKGHR
ncbi:MAG: hypothetical protein HQ523_02740 [Lentisphaerae bacterium]|nr:hypothetical protein [Lentisphaerota bacterium]